MAWRAVRVGEVSPVGARLRDFRLQPFRLGVLIASSIDMPARTRR